MTYPNKIAADASINPKYKDVAKYLSNEIINEFLELCKIPHPSGHVQKMRDYLLHWGLEHGVETSLDSSGCIYMDIPASKDCENVPKIILQCHFDMVAVAAVGNNNFNPITSPIKPFLDKENNCIHTKWHTSLGADNGHGIATCLALIKLHDNEKFNFPHGPIRFLFTYDEETTLQGCKLLNKDVLDAKYLINLDSISVGTIVTSAAGGFAASANKKFETLNSGDKTNTLKIKIWGLTGGHSGTDINMGRANTLALLTEYLDKLLYNSINFNFKFIHTGILMNAIPAKMDAELVFGYHDVKRAKEIAEKCIHDAIEKYSDGMSLEYDLKILESDNSEILSISDSMKIHAILKMLPMGVINTFDNGLPKTSNNVGLMRIEDGMLHSEFLFRSADKDEINRAAQIMTKTSFDTGIDFTIECIFPAWPKLEKNPLNETILKSYVEACGFMGDTLDIHAGLETGYLAMKRPDIIMASIGCDIVNEHTRKETFFIDSLPAYCASLLYTLENLNMI